MRKRNPNDVCATFQAEVAASLSEWQQTLQLVGRTGDLAKRASIDAFLRIAVEFEGFRSDWHIAAITRDASRFRTTLSNRVQHALVETDRQNLVPYLTPLSVPKHPTLAEVTALVDAGGRNLSISSLTDWARLAKRDLVDPWKGKIDAAQNSYPERTLVELVVAIRNAASHQSDSSAKALKDAIALQTHPSNQDFHRAVRSVNIKNLGVYLNGAVTTNGTQRVELIHNRLDGLAASLIVP